MNGAVAIALLAGCREKGSPTPEPAPKIGPWLFGAGQPHPDSDRDGWSDAEDCGPHDPRVYPGADEPCNGRDDDCDGIADDIDGDGAIWCEDCDDLDPESHPGRIDPFGDHIDQDCDGTDGVGLSLGEPVVGPEEDAFFGFALASEDLDGDGCDELLIGQPGFIYDNLVIRDDSLTLSESCWPWPSLTVRAGEHDLRGYSVAVAGSTLLAHDFGYRGGYGRVLLFDVDSFRSGGEPVLDVLGDDWRKIHTATLLGDGPEWLLWGRQGSFAPSTAYYGLLALPREGIFDLDLEEADHLIHTDSQIYVDGARVADIGDRAGDGNADLGFGQRWQDDNSVYFFHEVTSGHILDAPEVWRKGGGDIFNTNWEITGDADLDGDGTDDAIVADTNDDVDSVPNAGRVYLVPWLGDGEHSLMDEAPARIDGERDGDWTGIGSAAGDLDGDGQDDLVVGTPGSWNRVSRPGQVTVFPGPLQGVYTRADAAAVWVGPNGDDHAGTALAVGDLDGSGRLDLAVGAPHADIDGLDRVGAVFVVIDPL